MTKPPSASGARGLFPSNSFFKCSLSVAVGKTSSSPSCATVALLRRPTVSLHVRILASTCCASTSTFHRKLLSPFFHFGMLPSPFFLHSFLTALLPWQIHFFFGPLFLQLLDFLKDRLVKLFRSFFFADSSSFPSWWPAILASRPFARMAEFLALLFVYDEFSFMLTPTCCTRDPDLVPSDGVE